MSVLIHTSRKNIRITKKSVKHINVFIAGTGAVGGELLKQIQNLNNSQVNIRLTGLCNSKNVIWNPNVSALYADLLLSNTKTNWAEITDRIVKEKEKPLVFVDATGSSDVAKHYKKLLSNGVHVTTPSKIANTSDQKYYQELIDFNTRGIASYKFETTVGAGLPVIKTIQNLINSGDSVTEISGVVSGTMIYIFNQLQKGTDFSKIIKTAKEEGYSEPDPRDDLSGEDVARKFLILARTCGWEIERDQIEVQSLIPDEYFNLTKEEFFEALPQLNQYWKQQQAIALSENKRIRYVGSFKDGQIKVGIQFVPTDSPLGSLKGTDNLIQVFTRYYNSSPIVIQGPGAGKTVTAAGVLSDIIEISRNI